MRVLLTAASKHGATAEIAAAIADGLRGAGSETDHIDPADLAARPRRGWETARTGPRSTSQHVDRTGGRR